MVVRPSWCGISKDGNANRRGLEEALSALNATESELALWVGEHALGLLSLNPIL